MKSNKALLLWLPPILFLALFYFYPLYKIVGLSLNRSEVSGLSILIDTIKTPSIQHVIWFTVWQASISTILTLTVGLPGAYLFARYQFRGKSFIRALTGIAFVMPTLVVAAGFNALYGPKGWLNTGMMSIFGLDQPPIKIINTISAILIAHVFYNISIVLRLVGDFWTRIDPRLEHVAQSLGANRWHTFRSVTLPLLSPAILAAALLVFIFNFTSFGVILVLGGPRFATLEVEIYYQTISLFNLPLAAILSMLQLAITLMLTIVYTRIMKRVSRPLTQRTKRITQASLNGFKKRIFAGLVIGFLILLTSMPLISLAGQSIISLSGERTPNGALETGFTLDFYRTLTENTQDGLFFAPPSTAISISLLNATGTMVLALIIGLPTSWALASNKNNKFKALMDPILILPLGTSAVTLGLGFIIASGSPQIDLRASPFILPITHSLVAFPFVVRSLTPALQSIQPRLRNAASVLGASPWMVIKQIDFPLMTRAIIVAATFAFTISIGEFGVSAMITRPEYPTIPVVIFRYLTRPGGLNYGKAMALSTILMLITFCSMLVIERFRISEGSEF
jgi:thiamine transport system permease protein